MATRNMHPLLAGDMFVVATNSDNRRAYPVQGSMKSNDTDALSSINPGKNTGLGSAVITVNVLNALYYMSGQDISLFQPGPETYTCEMPIKFPDGTSTGRYLLVAASANGEYKAGIVDPSVGSSIAQLPPLGKQLIDKLPCFGALYVPIIMLVGDSIPAVKTDVDMVIEAMRKNVNLSEGTTSVAERNALFRCCDAVYYALQQKVIKPKVDNTHIDILSTAAVAAGSLASPDNLVLGNKNPSVIYGRATHVSLNRPMTVGEAKKAFAHFRNSQQIPAEDAGLIQQFPDDFPVPKEVITIASQYVDNLYSDLTMVNFAWRGVTGFGKSTGVELLSCILGLPMLRVTCHSSMEAPDFLAKFVPATKTDDSDTESSVKMPPVDVLMYDPETAYEMLTGVSKSGATIQDCLNAYAAAVRKEAANTRGSSQRFELVESDFVTALSKGYIVEVQEMSTILDAGVLVSLNEYDRPGAIIPLVDGRKLVRHDRALVIYTDNPGYAGRHRMDQAVIRRFNLIIDSYTLRKEDIIARIKYKTKFDDDVLLDSMYNVWLNLSNFCLEHDYTDGDTSFMGLMYWANAVKKDKVNLRDYAIMCMVAKATSDREEQEKIISAVIDTDPLFNSLF